MPTKEQLDFAIEVLYCHLESPARPGVLRNDVAEKIRELQKQRNTALEHDRPKWLTKEVADVAKETWDLHTTEVPMRLKAIEYLKFQADMAGQKISGGEGLGLFRKYVQN